MIDLPSDPPSNKQELFDRIRAVIDHGTFQMPAGSRYQGTGAPGMFLEDLLGLNAGSMDIPDAVGWEMKWFSARTSLVTLFHKEANGPKHVMRRMVQDYGWLDDKGRRSFRHTIRGESQLFRVKADESTRRITVTPKKRGGTAPYWSYDELVAGWAQSYVGWCWSKARNRLGKCAFCMPKPTKLSTWRTLYRKS